VRLLETPLVRLAREAISQREVTDEYGSRGECEVLMAHIERAQAQIHNRRSLAQEIRMRTKRLKQAARYRNAADTAPVADSLALPQSELADGPGSALTSGIPNVLAEDTWDLYRVLVR
jgi:hypothetical protein